MAIAALAFCASVPGWAAPFAYVPSFAAGTVSVIDLATHTVVATVTVGGRAVGAAVSPDGTLVYVTARDFINNQDVGSVKIISTASNAVVGSVSGMVSPFSLALLPDGSRAYVSDNSSNVVWVVDTTTRMVTGSIPVGGGPEGIALSPDGARAYVANSVTMDSSVSVIDTATNLVTTTIAVGAVPRGVAASPDGSRIYVANTSTNDVSVISTTTNAVIATIPGTDSTALAVSPNGARLYVTNRGQNSVAIFDTASLTLLTTVTVGTRPQGIAVTPDGSKVVAANNGSHNATVISTATNTVLATIPVGMEPFAIGTFIGGGPPPPVTLTIDKSGGDSAANVVASTPSGIQCGATCASEFAFGTTVNLTATPAPGNLFTGWSGACTGTGSCTVTMNANRAVSATFAFIPAAQFITFGPPPILVEGGSAVVSATGGGSGNPVTFTSTTPAICTTGGTNGAMVTSLSGGTCIIAANQAGGAAFAPAAQVTQGINIIPAGQTLGLLAVKSRRNHGAAGFLDLPVDAAVAFDGAVSVEPRAAAGGSATLVFQFNSLVTAIGALKVTDEASVILPASAAISSNEVIVTLPSIGDNKRVHVSIASVNGQALGTTATVGLLRADVNDSRNVNAIDLSRVKARAGQPAGNDDNLRYDINLSGTVTAADIAVVKARNNANLTGRLAPSVARVTIEPAGVLLTQVGASRTLTAVVTDALGRRLDVPVTWSSSRPANIAIDANGLATASSLNGATQIVATANGVNSTPVLGVATATAAGAILLTDDQIVGDPVDVNPAAAPNFTNAYDVRLTGVAPPAPGTLLISTGTKAVAGQVQAVDTMVSPMRVTMRLVPLAQLFPSLEIDEQINLANSPADVPGDLAGTYDMVRSGDTFTFTPKPMGSKAPALASIVQRTGGGITERSIRQVMVTPPPPFKECEATFSGGGGMGGSAPFTLSTPPLFSASVSPTLDLKHTTAGGLQRIVVNAEPTVKFEGGINLAFAFEGKVDCKRELFTLNFYAPGALAFFLSLQVPVGLGLEASGKLTVATAGVGVKVESKASAQAGIDCPSGLVCNFVRSLGSFDTKVTPSVDLPSVGDIRFEPSLAAFGTLDLRVGSPIAKSLQFKMLSAKAGAKFAGSFATRKSQLADDAYASDYKVSLDAGAGVGVDLGEALKLFGLTSFTAVELAISTELGRSPAGLATGAITANKTSFSAGETIDFTIKLQPTTLEFLPVIGPYNVKTIQLVRKVVGQTLTTVDVVASQNAFPGEHTFNISYVAPDAGNAGQFSAFVVTWVVPFELLALELGSVTEVLEGQIAAGGKHSCALTAAGGVKCWGRNDSGQLGNGTVVSSTVPVDVTGLASGVKAVIAGGDNTCALTTAGGAKCWGSNSYGQIGDGTTTNRNVPTDVIGLSSNVAVIQSSGAHTCALDTTGIVKCWGFNDHGALGDGTYVDKTTPTLVSGLLGGATALSLAQGPTCVLTGAGTVRCWGYPLLFEGPGPEFKDQFQTTPAAVAGLEGATSLSASRSACGIVPGGAVKCVLLEGTTLPAPITINGLASGVVGIHNGNIGLCAIMAGGTVKCASAENSVASTDVSGLVGVNAISVGGSHYCAKAASGALKCWFNNDFGQLGDGTTTFRPDPVSVVGFP